MRLLRRALMALGMTGMIAAALRLRGKGGVPPQHGGWRELPLESTPPRPAAGKSPSSPSA